LAPKRNNGTPSGRRATRIRLARPKFHRPQHGQLRSAKSDGSRLDPQEPAAPGQSDQPTRHGWPPTDNNLFDDGAPDNDDGAAVITSYRITALCGRDAVLSVRRIKHFGMRRLAFAAVCPIARRLALAHRRPITSGVSTAPVSLRRTSVAPTSTAPTSLPTGRSS
jgi:hypothetical protein